MGLRYMLGTGKTPANTAIDESAIPFMGAVAQEYHSLLIYAQAYLAGEVVTNLQIKQRIPHYKK